MPKYLIHGSYTEAGVQGVLKEGGSSRRDAIAQAAKSMGGRLESFYFAFGATDFYVVVELPDQVSAVAASLLANVTGAVKTQTTVLITPEEVDQALKKGGAYRAPGQS